jgi:hypothetical protein
MSTISGVKKAFNGGVQPPALIGADLGTRGNDFWMFSGPGGYDYKFTYTNSHSSLKAFKKCPPLFSIILKKAQAYANGKTWILNKKGKAKEKESTSPIAVKIRSLLAKPNPLQSQKEFETQLYSYCQLYGFSIVLPIIPVGYEKYEATKLWNLPLHLLDIEETRKSWLLAESNKDVIKYIVLDFGEQKVNIPVEMVWIFKDFAPSFDSSVFPSGRVASHQSIINNIIGCYETRGRIIDDRGAQGIISSDAKDSTGFIPIKEEDKVDLQNDFRNYGLKRHQWQYIITSAAVKWTQITQSTKDLMLFEEIEDDIMRLCDGWTYPYPLMSSNRTNTLGGNNIYEAKKLLYQDAIIPEAENLSEQLASFLELSKHGLTIEKDYSHVQALQDDKLQYARWRNTLNDAKKKEYDAGLITLNDWLVALGDDPLPAELGDIRATDVKNSTVPLAVTIGVGGVQGLIAVVTAQAMSVEARQATLEIVFGLAPADAQRMAQDSSAVGAVTGSQNNQQSNS